MILRFYPTKDATIYERSPNKNAGLDAVLDISKVLDGSTAYNSRALLDFDFEAIAQTLLDRGLEGDSYSASWKLKMYIAEEHEVPLDYQINCYMVSGPWSMGIGRHGNIPETTVGVSWNHRVSPLDPTTAWGAGSSPAGTTWNYATNPGGGEWYALPEVTQSFNYKSGDLDLDVSEMVPLLLASIDPATIPPTYGGFLIKKQDSDESSNLPFRSLKYFSRDTHTIYSPILEYGYDDSEQDSSLPSINTSGSFNVVAVNMRQEYKETSVHKIRFAARPTYPVATFVTEASQLQRYILPAGSQYAIYSAHTDDVIIDFSNNTTLSSDEEGNYFQLSFENFQPERYYRFVLKIKNSATESGLFDYQIYDNNWVFRVSRK